jgi:hypothetical protein
MQLDGKKLSNHIKSKHGLTSEEYTIKYLCNNIQPFCKNCGNQTRYVAFSFKEYCVDCAKIAMKAEEDPSPFLKLKQDIKAQMLTSLSHRSVTPKGILDLRTTNLELY